jgi:tRNA-specific 2-thiouridylase
MEPPAGKIRAMARIRYRHPEAGADIEPTGRDSVKVMFDTPQMAVTPGQSVVLYDNDVVLGGGVIEGYSSRPADVPSEECQ